MGQSEEKANIENYSKSKEGESIIDIEKPTLEQNIYIFVEIIKFFLHII